MAEQFKNLASTTLNGDIDDTTTSVVVTSAMGFTGGDFRVLIDSEIMKVTGVSGTTFTVVRHQEGTSAASHSSTTAVYHILTAGALDAHVQNDMASYDTYASKPAAGTPGRIFLPTDGAFLERDNGSTWEKFGPIWPMTPPVAADFATWVNQGTATITDNKGAIYLQTNYNNGESLRICAKTYPTPPFTVEMALIPNNPGTAFGAIGFGICVRDSVSGKIQGYGPSPAGAASPINIKGYNYSSPTNGNSSITGWPTSVHIVDTSLVWLKYVDNSSNRIISISVDGYTWTQLVSLALTDYVTPNQIGIFVNAYRGYDSTKGSAYVGATFLHWRQY